MEAVLDVGEIARSAFNVWKGDLPGDWDRLSADEQAIWTIFAKRAPERLALLEGKPYSEAAAEVWAIFQRARGRPVTIQEFAHAAPLERLAFEAVARHLALLMDSDEADPAKAEQMWIEWRRERINPTRQQ